jgi:hypothetical protein
MLSCLVSLWMVATVGQAPAEASWLKSVPADVSVVARIRALEDVSGDLLAMLKTMSPAAAEAARNAVEPQLQAFEGTYGAAASKNPFFVLFRLPDPAQPNLSAWGVIVKTGDAAAVIKGLGQDGGEKPKTLDGYESFPAKDGQTWYTTKGTGWVAFGPDEAMIKAVHKPQSSLAEALSPEVQAKFLAGDVGLCLDIAAVQKQYGDVIEQAKPALMAQLEQAPNAGGAQNVKNAKAMFDALTEGLKVGDRLALSLDFDADGLTLSGLATVKGDTPAARSLAQATTATGELMAKLPGDKMAYFFGAGGTGSPTGQPKLGAGSAPEAKTSPEVDRAVAARMQALEGRLVTGMTMMPMQAVSLADPKDPQAAVQASLEADKARQAQQEAKMTIEPNALSHGGFQFTRVKTEVDPQKMAKEARPDVPNAAEIFKKVVAGNAITTYTGTDGKLFVEAMAPSDDQMKAQIDAIKDGSRSLGSLASWKSLRAKLPERATVLVLLSAQETVKMIFSSVSAMSNNADMKLPADLPKAPALIGFALITSPKGYDFRLIIPGDVGPVFEKGLAPLGRGN